MSDTNNVQPPALKLTIMVGSSQPTALAECYTTVFGRPADWNDGDWHGWQAGSGYFMLGAHSEVVGQSKEPARMILNLEMPDVQAEFERLKNAGITVIKEPYDIGGGWIATLADPDGNYFQLVTPMEM